MRDNSIAPEDVYEESMAWITSYFAPFPDLASVTPQSVMERKRLSEVSPNAPNLVTRITQAELAELTCPEVYERVGVGLVEWQVYAENIRRALLDTRGAWKNVKFIAAWGSMSVWSTAWGARGLLDLLEMPADEDAQRRQIEIVRVEDANHFVCAFFILIVLNYSLLLESLFSIVRKGWLDLL
jgi:hypothetical protein